MATLAKVREETSAKANKLCSDRNRAAARHHEPLAFIPRVVKGREERKDKAADTLLKLCKVFDECGKDMVRRTWRNGIRFESEGRL